MTEQTYPFDPFLPTIESVKIFSFYYCWKPPGRYLLSGHSRTVSSVRRRRIRLQYPDLVSFRTRHGTRGYFLFHPPLTSENNQKPQKNCSLVGGSLCRFLGPKTSSPRVPRRNRLQGSHTVLRRERPPP